MYIAIQPKEEIITRTYTASVDANDFVTYTQTYNMDNISISVIELKLNAYAAIETVFFEGNTFVKKTIDILNGDDYKNWSSDDNYIINWIANKYQLNLA